MFSLQDVHPTEPLLWISERPLVALTYLWHLSHEEVTDNGKIDLLWKLTRQLLIAVHQEKNYPLDPQDIEKLFLELEKDSTLSSLMESGIIHKDLLIQILQTQEVDFRHRQNLSEKIATHLSDDDEVIRAYYEENDKLVSNNVYEVYEYAENENIASLSREGLLSFPKEKLEYFGALTKEDLEKMGARPHHYEESDLPTMMKNLENPERIFIIQAFHASYKAPYDLIKPKLVELFTQSLVEQALEEEAQEYLDTTPIHYNEQVLEKVLKLKNL